MSETHGVPIKDVAELFARTAQMYCTWIEATECRSRDDLLEARRLLSELHLLAIALPRTIPQRESIEEVLSHEEWKQIYERLSNGALSVYWDVFNPLESPTDSPVANSLADDLADIYRDLRRGLKGFEGKHYHDAVWSWRFGYHSHWGAHLTSALRALHCYLAEEELEPD